MGPVFITVIGQCMGAKDVDQAKFYFSKLIKWSLVFSIIWNVLVLAITPFLDLPLTAKICMTFAVILLVYRHKENIKRIKNHTESKIQWM